MKTKKTQFLLPAFFLCLMAASPVQAAQKLLAWDGTPGNKFGGSVSFSSSTWYKYTGEKYPTEYMATIGAENDCVGCKSGSLYLFGGSLGNLSPFLKYTVNGLAVGSEFGHSVSSSFFVIKDYLTSTYKYPDTDSEGKPCEQGKTCPIVTKRYAVWLVAGAPGDDVMGGNSGSSYVSNLVCTIFTEEFKAMGYPKLCDARTTYPLMWTSPLSPLVAADGETEDRFGTSISMTSSGCTQVAGAPGDDSMGSNSGSAYAFYTCYDSTKKQWIGPQQLAKFTAADGAPGDEFGSAVAVSADGTTAAVGAPGDDDKGSRSGSVYIFTRGADSTWCQDAMAKLVALDGDADSCFGSSVALSADGYMLAVGAHCPGSKGSAYIFTRASDNSFTQVKLTPTDGGTGICLGSSVSLSSDGNTAVIGAECDDDKGSNSGSTYVFTRTGTNTWQQKFKIIADDGQDDDWFGHAVSVSGDASAALIGAFRDDDRGLNSGSAYVYSLSGTLPVLLKPSLLLRTVTTAISASPMAVRSKR